MTKVQRFGLGALGAILPILVSLITVDLAPIIDGFGSLTPGVYIGYGIRVLALLVVGGIVALINAATTSPLALLQIGVAAPALVTSLINGASPPAKPQVNRTAFFEIVSMANAEESILQPRVRVASGLFDSIKGGIAAGFTTRLDAVGGATKSIGNFCVTAQGKALLPGPASKIGSSCTAGSSSGLVTD
jgi:hypothetical protein